MSRCMFAVFFLIVFRSKIENRVSARNESVLQNVQSHYDTLYKTPLICTTRALAKVYEEMAIIKISDVYTYAHTRCTLAKVIANSIRELAFPILLITAYALSPKDILLCTRGSSPKSPNYVSSFSELQLNFEPFER